MKKILIIGLLFTILYGCRKENNFPDEPIIKTVSFDVTSDLIASWVFSFTDGNGDLGSDNDLDTNYFQTLHISSPTLDTSIVLAGERLPKINTSGINKGVEGEITRFIELDFYQFSLN